MLIRILLGPAGSGKTFQCLAEARQALAGMAHRQPAPPPGSPPGGTPGVSEPRLLFLAPKQATFQIERQLLASPVLPGFSNLLISSFPRLATQIINATPGGQKPLISAEGRVMVLRALLNRHRDGLSVFRSGARLRGLARELSDLLRVFQEHKLPPARLREMAEAREIKAVLKSKLLDSALILEAYLDWLRQSDWMDADQLLAAAVDALERQPAGMPWGGHFDRIWMDGFAEMTPQELDLLAAIIARSDEATLAFCLDHAPQTPSAWTSPWSVIGETFRKCHQRLAAMPGARIEITLLNRDGTRSRFSSQPALRHLETHWVHPRPAAWIGSTDPQGQFSFNWNSPDPRPAVRLVEAPGVEEEAMAAADEVEAHVRSGGRYREAAVLMRGIESHVDAFRRVFRRRGIPCFIDQRISAAHHPLAELTRNALRTVSQGWRQEDWLAVIKSGLAGVSDHQLDGIESEALKRGWTGERWREPFPNASPQVETLRARLVRPFLALEERLSTPVSGAAFAAALRALWRDLDLPAALQVRRMSPSPGHEGGAPDPSVAERDQAVWNGLVVWLEDLELALGQETLPSSEWITIAESGLAALTVGVIPPALDQVLIGAIDRSRNPDLQLVVLPGWNHGLFPRSTNLSSLLIEHEWEAMIAAGAPLEYPRNRLGHEKFYAYIALTRARCRVVVTWAATNAAGRPLERSPFIRTLEKLFPSLPVEIIPSAVPEGLPDAIAPIAEMPTAPRLEPGLTRALYGTVLRSSVSRLEQFAACPFRFFAHSGLRLEEWQEFELDVRERGSFLHEVLEVFHRGLKAEGRRWRDCTPSEAQNRIQQIVRTLLPAFRDGLLQSDALKRFQSGQLAEQLGRVVAATIQWLQFNQFDPVAVEIPFGEQDGGIPPWNIPLDHGRSMALRGRIDRIDRWLDPSTGVAWVCVVDYKSSARRLDRLKLINGLQLQLPVYLAVAAHAELPESPPGQLETRPAGMVYVPIQSRPRKRSDRSGSVESPEVALKHRGLLAAEVADRLQGGNAPDPTQFALRRKKDGAFAAGGDAVSSEILTSRLDEAQDQVRTLGMQILDGTVSVTPYRHGQATACDYCEYQSVCRFEPATTAYRALKPVATPQGPVKKLEGGLG